MATVCDTSGGKTRRGAAADDAGPGRAQLARLFRIVLVLQEGQAPNARELAELCEVSRRTIYRDLELLATAGVPVRYRVERQGYALGREFFLGPTGLSEREALALLLLVRQGEPGPVAGLLADAAGGAAKVVQALPAEQRERVLAAAQPFGPAPGPLASAADDRRRLYETVLDAVARRKQLRIWYRDPETLDAESTKFSVFRVLARDGQWVLVGRSSRDRRVVLVALPWVDRVEVTDDPAAVPPRFNLTRFLGPAWGLERDPFRYRVLLRFEARAAVRVRDRVWHPSQRLTALADGRLEVQFVVNGLDEILRWVLGFGDEVEVLAPAELRDRLYEVAARVARVHAPERGEGDGSVERPG